MSWVQKKKIKK